MFLVLISKNNERGKEQEDTRDKRIKVKGKENEGAFHDYSLYFIIRTAVVLSLRFLINNFDPSSLLSACRPQIYFITQREKT